MRNVVVSDMAEQGVSATLMSSALGHKNTSTLSKYLSLSYGEGSNEANKVIEKIVGKNTESLSPEEKQKDEKRKPSMAEKFVGITSIKEDTE